MPVEDRTKRLLKQVSKLQVVGAAVVLVLLVVFYFIADAHITDVETLALVRGVTVSLIPVFLLAVLSWYVLLPITEIRREEREEELARSIAEEVKAPNDSIKVYAGIERVPWQSLFENSHSVEILVHYFDSWIRQQRADFISLFKRGGRVSLVIPDTQEAWLINAIASRFPDSTTEEITTKISRTAERLSQLNQEAGNNGSISSHSTKTLTWYCVLRFSNGLVALSPYEHSKALGVDAPFFVVRLSDHPGLRDWLEREFSKVEPTNSDENHEPN